MRASIVEAVVISAVRDRAAVGYVDVTTGHASVLTAPGTAAETTRRSVLLTVSGTVVTLTSHVSKLSVLR